jgi:hypothetical protein
MSKDKVRREKRKPKQQTKKPKAPAAGTTTSTPIIKTSEK